MADNNDVRILDAPSDQQDKVGTGKVDKNKVEQLQQRLNNTDVDFAPMAMEFLKELEAGIKEAETNADKSKQELYQQIANPVMQLKANAAMFKYELIGELATHILNLIENAPAFDKNTIAIADGLHKALTVIVVKKMKGDGGTMGQALKGELLKAADRYVKKVREGG